MKPEVFDLDSANFNRERQPIPAPSETVFPDRAEYVGCPKSSDAGTIAGPLASPKQARPGAAPPGQPWQSVDPPMRKRGALR